MTHCSSMLPLLSQQRFVTLLRNLYIIQEEFGCVNSKEVSYIHKNVTGAGRMAQWIKHLMAQASWPESDPWIPRWEKRNNVARLCSDLLKYTVACTCPHTCKIQHNHSNEVQLSSTFKTSCLLLVNCFCWLLGHWLNSYRQLYKITYFQ